MGGSLGNIYNNLSFSLQMHSSMMAELQEQAYTGSRINRASDDPSAAYQVLGLQSQEEALSNYMDNISETIGTLETSSTIINEMMSVMVDGKVYLTQITNGIYGSSGRERLAISVNDSLDQMLSLANTKQLNQYLFGGGNVTSAPYVAERTNGEVTSVTYQGSYEGREIAVADGVEVRTLYVGDELFRSNSRNAPEFLGSTGAAAGSGTSSVKGDVWLTVTDDGGGSYNLSIDDGATTVNVALAADITNIAVTNANGEVLYVDATNISAAGTEPIRVPGTYDIFNTLISIRDLLRNERGLADTEIASLVTSSIESIEETRDLLVGKAVIIGSKIGFLDKIKNSIDDMKFNAESEMSSLQDVDIAQLAIDISRREVLYQVSLSFAGKLMSMSLMDFIR